MSTLTGLSLRGLLAGTLTLLAVVAVLPLTAEKAHASDDYERVVDITYPVSGKSSYINDYHQDRGGGTRKHQGTDLMAPKLAAVHATVDGTVCVITGINEPMPSYGYYLRLCGDDGLRYNYVHLNNDSPGTDDGAGGPEWAYAPGIRKGVRVKRGQWLGYLGDSGNAESTPPHLHFEITDPDLADPRIAEAPYKPDRLNPYFSLNAAVARGDVPAPPSTTSPSPGPTPGPTPTPSSAPSPAPTPTPTPTPTPAPTPAPTPTPTPTPTATPAPTPSPTPPPDNVMRLAGSTRVQTAIALSEERTGDTRAVVIVPAGSHAEALVAAPLAALVDAPVLLTGQAGLDSDVAAEVRRLEATSAYLVGSTAQLAPQTEQDLSAAGITAMARLAAPDAFALSAAVAREILSYPNMTKFPSVLLALGEAPDPSRAWPDALSATALAARLRVPILLTRGGELPDTVATVLDELQPAQVQVIGGTAAVTDAVASAAAQAAGGAHVERLSGKTRYGTSVAVAQAGVAAGLTGSIVWLATGRNFPDALAAGPAAARAGSPLLLVDGQTAGGAPESEAWLKSEAGRLEALTVVGGPSAVSSDVAHALARQVQ